MIRTNATNRMATDDAMSHEPATGALESPACSSRLTIAAPDAAIAPVSWLVQRHVDEGRDELNFSEWHLEQEGDEAAETVRDRSMPTWDYMLTHPEARLSDDELAVLATGLAATLGDGGGHEDGDD
jgi:hypothetical protein